MKSTRRTARLVYSTTDRTREMQVYATLTPGEVLRLLLRRPVSIATALTITARQEEELREGEAEVRVLVHLNRPAPAEERAQGEPT